MDAQVQKLDIGKWIEKELSNLSGSEIESLANEELEKFCKPGHILFSSTRFHQCCARR